jgi:hypothetical protein
VYTCVYLCIIHIFTHISISYTYMCIQVYIYRYILELCTHVCVIYIHVYMYVYMCIYVFPPPPSIMDGTVHTRSHLAKCNILHHSTIHQSTLQNAAAHYNSLQHCVVSRESTPSATHRNIMRFHAACNILLKTSWIMRMITLCFDVCNIESWHIWLISNDGTQAGYNSGMGEIFRKVAEISSPAGVSRALPAGV